MRASAGMCVADIEGSPATPPDDACPESGRHCSPSPRRVLYVVSQFPSWTETFIVREIRTLVEHGVDVRILSLKRSSEAMVQADAAALMDRVWQPPGPALTLLNAARAGLSNPVMIARATATVVAGTWRNPAVLLKSLATLARSLGGLWWLRRFDPEYIHAHWSTYPATAAWMLARVMGRPFGFTCHAHDVFVNRQLLPRKIEDAALAVTISRHNVDWLARNVSAVARRKLEVVHCGVELQQFPWKPEGRSGNRILGVGRLAPEKGFHTLVEALALLHADGIAFECTLVGEGPARASLQGLIDGHGLHDKVELAGALPQEAVRAALEAATVFALPCQVAASGSRDGIPVALMEAMASGCAVVSCPVSGVPELIVDGVDGLLAPERDVNALAGALRRLLEDEPLRRRLAVAARQRIEREFDARKEALKLHGLMSSAVARRRERILLVIDGMEVGGSQRQVQHLLDGLDRGRWAPELAFFRNDSFLVDAIRRRGIPVHCLPKRGRVDLRFLFAFARLLRRGDFALIHAYSLTAESWSLLARVVSGRRPLLVASERSYYIDRPRWHWWLKRIVIGRSAVVIANSRAGARATALRTRTPDARFATIANGVDLPEPISRAARAAIRGSLGAPDGRLLGLFVGRLVPAKNLPCLVQALAMLAPRQRPWIAIAGDGPLRASTQQLAVDSGVAADLCFLGERADATRLMQAADFLVLPSHYEGLSNALLEAMAAGCAVIASAVGGSPELIEDGRTGLLFPNGDASALAGAIARIADPALRARLAHAARRHVMQRHSQAALAAATSSVYLRCLGAVDQTAQVQPARGQRP
jgi:glycosyltransferase involved in cell wall biosynthesis